MFQPSPPALVLGVKLRVEGLPACFSPPRLPRFDKARQRRSLQGQWFVSDWGLRWALNPQPSTLNPQPSTCRDNGLFVIEDCAEAYDGNDYKGDSGSDAAFFRLEFPGLGFNT